MGLFVGLTIQLLVPFLHHRQSSGTMTTIDEKKDTTQVEHVAVHNYGEDDHTVVKAVQNVALADAAAKDRPRLFTKNMFMVQSALLIL